MRLRNPHLIHAVSFHGLTPTIDIEPKKEEAGRLPLLYEGRHPAVPMPKTPLKKEARGLPFFRYSMLMK